MKDILKFAISTFIIDANKKKDVISLDVWSDNFVETYFNSEQ